MAKERDIIENYYEIVQSFTELYRNLSLYYINQVYGDRYYNKYRRVVEQYLNYKPVEDRSTSKSPFAWPYGE